MNNGCTKVRLVFQSPLGGIVKRKHILTFPPDIILQDVAELVSGAGSTKSLWPASFGEWLGQTDARLLMCYWNESQWEPLPIFSSLKDLKSDLSVDEPVWLLFSVLTGKLTPMVHKPALLPQKTKVKAKVSNSDASTKDSSEYETEVVPSPEVD